MSTVRLNLRRIDPLRWGIIVGLLYAILSLIVVVPMMGILGVAGAMGGEEIAMPFAALGGMMAMVILPILYGVIGFIFGIVGTALLNFLLGKLGGLDMDFERPESDFTNIEEIGKDI